MYRALLVCNSLYEADPKLHALHGPRIDGRLLSAALTDDEMGVFASEHVSILFDASRAEIAEAANRFFSDAEPDDVLLFYFSGHGRSRNQKLYLCARDTTSSLLPGTAVSNDTLNDIIGDSLARAKVIVLDCCHSGAFKGPVAVERLLAGKGRFVLTATAASETAADADGEDLPSPFTNALVDGLLHGADDKDGDGMVDLADLYEYLQAAVRGSSEPRHRFDGFGNVPIARRPVSVAADLPDGRSEAERLSTPPEDSDHPFLDGTTTATVLSPRRVSRFRAAMRKDVGRSVPRRGSAADFMRAALLMREGRLTRAGALLFGEDPTAVVPTATVQCTHYHGPGKDAPMDKRTLGGTIPEQIKQARDFVAELARLGEVPTTGAAVTEPVYRYPMIAVREIIANALAHRDYQQREMCVHVRVFSDRIEVTSPGTWAGAELADDEQCPLSELRSESRQRNFWLAHVLSWNKLVESEGAGIPRAVADCRQQGAAGPIVARSGEAVTVKIFPSAPLGSTVFPDDSAVRLTGALADLHGRGASSIKVYISATQKDLLDHRAAVHTAARRLAIDDVAMEAYGTQVQSPLERCLADVRRSDVYVGLFAWRYGYRPPGQESSITELEYREAIAAGKPCLIFLLAEDTPWPVDMIDRDADWQRIIALRRELQERHLCAFFSNVDDLAAKVTVALADVRRHRPPGRESADPDTHLPQALRSQYYQQLAMRYRAMHLDAVSPRPTSGYLTVGLPEVFVEPRVHEDARPEMPLAWWRWASSTSDGDAGGLPGVVDPEDVERLWDEYAAKDELSLFDVVSDPGRRTIVLLGDAGSGKSAAARYLTLTLAGVCVEPRLSALDRYLPVLIELRSYATHHGDGRCDGLLDYVGHRHQQGLAGFDQDVLEAYLRQGGQALFLFDGLDEVFDPAQREEVAAQIATFANEYPGVLAVVTSRAVGYQRHTFANAGFDHFTLEDLDDEQIARFLGNWYRHVMPTPAVEAERQRRQILDVVGSSRAMREIAGNPLLLMLMAIVGRGHPLPRNRRRLYAHVTDVLISEWDVTKQLRESHGDVPSLDLQAKRRLLRHLAYWMQFRESGPAGNYIESDELARISRDHLVAFYGFENERALAMAYSMIDKLRQRSFILERYGLRLFGFVHRAFLEFFCAEEIVDRCEQDPTTWDLDRLRSLFREHWADPSWREVLRLVASALPAQTVNKLVTLLATEATQPWPPLNLTGPPWNLVLAAQCVAEAPQPAELAGAGTAVLRQVVRLIEHGISADDPNLVDLTEQELLSPIRALGPSWPGREIFLHWYRRRGVRTSWRSGSPFATRIAAVLSTTKEQMEELLVRELGQSPDRQAGVTLVAGLAEAAGQLDTTSRGRRYCRDQLLVQARAEASTAVRQAAVRALVAHFSADPDLIDMLRGLADSPDPAVRAIAVQSLGGVESSEDIRQLLLARATEDRDATVRRAAAEILAARPDLPGVPEMMQRLLATDTDPGVVQCVLKGLLVLPQYAETAGATALLRVNGHSPDEVRCCILTELLPERPGPENTELLLKLAWSDTSARVRAVAVRRLALVPDSQGRCRARLIDQIEQDGESSVRAAAVAALIDRDRADDTGWTVVARTAHVDEDATVRLAAVRALAKAYPDHRTGELLLESARSDPTASVRLAAVDLLTGRPLFGHATRDLLISRASQERDPIVRLRVTRSLARLADPPDPEVRECLAEQVRRDPDPNVLRAAAQALAGHGDTDGLVATLCRRARRDSYAGSRLAAVQALCTDGSPDAVTDVLLECIETDTEPAVIDAALHRLTQPDLAPMAAAVRTRLMRRLADDDPAVRARTAAALGEHFGTDPAVRMLLVGLIRDDPDLDVRRRTVEQLATMLTDWLEGRELLIRLVDHDDWEIRRTALLAMARHNGADPRTRTVLVRLAHQEDDDTVRWLAGQLLATLPGTSPDDFP
ncbi:HEAT repeat domain-containing protein [Micromonospora sp. NBC_00821]|uniref:caspase, EACC1-associated type n=1 Tax=Micromonospora sp. NBC_00821 TaxID=2975977 RepID=UPI002ED2C6D9|nr:HEAT repeat domain-containing protein [Micromonospora sp. NBC_00821]